MGVQWVGSTLKPSIVGMRNELLGETTGLKDKLIAATADSNAALNSTNSKLALHSSEQAKQFKDVNEKVDSHFKELLKADQVHI